METDNQRYEKLGNFIKARRERIHPTQVGISDTSRRRTSGLRREEVAMLAGIGVTWYTWLEQGWDVNPSTAVMAAIDGFTSQPCSSQVYQVTPTSAS